MVYILLIKDTCPYSRAAVKLLKDKQENMEVYVMGKDFTNYDFKQKYGAGATYPRVYKNKKLIGGYDDLESSFR